MRKQLLFLFSILILISLVTAAPPFQESSSTDGFHIRTAAPESIKFNTTFDFHVHVFNESNGVPINNGINCYLHLYNTTGHHLYEGIDNVSSHAWDYGWDIPASNFTQIGEMPYIVQCNSTTQGGFVASSIHITPDGKIQSFAQGVGSFSYLFLMLALTILLGWMGFKLSESDKLWVLGILFIFLSMLFVVYDVWLGYEYHRNYTGATSSGMPEIIFYIFMFILIAGLVISAILLFTKWEKLVKRFKQELKDKQFKLEEDEIDRSFDF